MLGQGFLRLSVLGPWDYQGMEILVRFDLHLNSYQHRTGCNGCRNALVNQDMEFSFFLLDELLYLSDTLAVGYVHLYPVEYSSEYMLYYNDTGKGTSYGIIVPPSSF
jgi:hypothetical protein